MRLSSDLVKNSPAYVNPIKEREINLRGYKIAIIENLGVTQDQYETFDLSDNEILKLDNFPLLKRLTSLLLSNNKIRTIASGLGQYLPKLQTVVLTNNKLASLQDLDPLAEFKELAYLSLLQNPVTKQKNYRPYVIHKLPKLRVLDYQKVKQKEREEAKKLFKDEPASSETKDDKKDQMTDDEAVVAETNGDRPKVYTGAERQKIVEQINAATSLEEVDRLGKLLGNSAVSK